MYIWILSRSMLISSRRTVIIVMYTWLFVAKHLVLSIIRFCLSVRSYPEIFLLPTSVSLSKPAGKYHKKHKGIWHVSRVHIIDVGLIFFSGSHDTKQRGSAIVVSVCAKQRLARRGCHQDDKEVECNDGGGNGGHILVPRR